MKTFDQLHQILTEIRKQNTKLIPAIGYGAAGAIASFKTQDGLIQAECLSAIAPGDAVVLAHADTGEWFAIGSSAQVKNVTVTQNRRRKVQDTPASGITALLSGSIVYPNIDNRHLSTYAFWLKSARSLKRFDINFVPYASFYPLDISARLVYLTAKEAIVQVFASDDSAIVGLGGDLAGKTSYFEGQFQAASTGFGSGNTPAITKFNFFTFLIQGDRIIHAEGTSLRFNQRVFSPFWDKYRGWVVSGLQNPRFRPAIGTPISYNSPASALNADYEKYAYIANEYVDSKVKRVAFRSPPLLSEVHPSDPEVHTIYRFPFFKHLLGASPATFQTPNDRAILRLSLDSLGAEFSESNAATYLFADYGTGVNAIDGIKESDKSPTTGTTDALGTYAEAFGVKGGDTDPMRSRYTLRLEEVRGI